MGWRDVQAGVASGAINYAKKPDKFGSFLEGFATTYAAGVQKKADRDYAAKLAADKLKIEEQKEEKTRRQKREEEDQENKAAAKAALDMVNIPHSNTAAYQKAFSLVKGGNTSLQVGEYFKTGIGDGTIVPTQAYETFGPMPEAATTDMSVFSPLTGRESGIGGYDALLNQSQKNQFADIKVSQMNLGEVLAFQSERGGTSYHEWSKTNMPEGTEAKAKGLGSTPAGKYQFVGDTMKDIKQRGWKELGFDENTPFNEDTQDALFLWLAQDKMKGASSQEQKRMALRNTWEGIKDPADVSDAEIDKIIASVETGVFSSDDVQTAGATGPDPLAKLKPGQTVTLSINQGSDIKEGGTGGPNDKRTAPFASKTRQSQKGTATVNADGTLELPGYNRLDVSKMSLEELNTRFNPRTINWSEDGPVANLPDFNPEFMTGRVYLSDEKGELLNYNTGTEQDRNIPAGMQFNVTQRPFDEIDISNINTLDEYNAMDRNLQAGSQRVSQQFQTVWDNLKTTLTAADNATKIEEFLSLDFAMDTEATVEDIDNGIKIAKAKFGEDVVIPAYIATARTIIADRPPYTEDELRELDYNQRLLIEKTHPNGNIKALAASINMVDPQRFPSGIELGKMPTADLEGVIAGVEATILPLEEDGGELDPVSRDFLKTARFIIASRQSGSIADLVKPENLMKLSSGDAIENLIAAATGAGMDAESPTITQANAILASVRAAEDGQVDYSKMPTEELLGKIALENASENPDQAKLTAMNVIFNSREGKFDIKDYDDVETPTIRVEIDELSKKIQQQQAAVSEGTEDAGMSAQDSARLLAIQSLVSKRQAEKDGQVVFAKDSPTYIISYKDPTTNELVVSTAQVLANGNLYDTGSRKVVPEGVEIKTSDLELNSAKGQLLAQMQTRDLQPVKLSRQSSASMLRSAFILNSYVDPAQDGNPDILTTVGSVGSRFFSRADEEISAFNAMLAGGASQEELMAGIDARANQYVSQNNLKGQARLAYLFEAEALKFAYTFAGSSLEQRGAGLSNKDFANAKSIVTAGADFVTFSKNLKSQVSQGLSATQVKINDLKNNSPQIKLLNELDPTKDLTSGYTMNLSDWFKTQNLNTEYNWVNSETAAPASTAKPDAVQPKSVSELVNPYRDSATFAADRKAFEELAASPENQTALLKAFSNKTRIPLEVLRKLYTQTK